MSEEPGPFRIIENLFESIKEYHSWAREIALETFSFQNVSKLLKESGVEILPLQMPG